MGIIFELIFQVFFEFQYEFLGKLFFGRNFIENRNWIPKWKRILLGTICVSTTIAIGAALYFTVETFR